MPSNIVKPSHKAIQNYYQALKEYAAQGVTHEGATETAFQRLLADIARLNHCTLIPKQKLKIGKQPAIFPDGTIRDTLYTTRLGFWEAKDTDDDLDKEISKKIAKGYPLTNTIFEDTRRAVLFQGGRERNRFDLADKKQLADLLNDFFAYHEPEIESFQQAVEEFKDRVPDLAKGLVAKLEEAHKGNKKFQVAFENFFALCKDTLNPNISRAAVDEMLVQHLLTERLFRTIFQDSDFVRRNVIAAEIEKVIAALTGLTFSREHFLKSLDRFYRAIEDAARTLEDFSEKQHFLNTVYERFFQGYSVKVADTHGIVYTPQEIVDFMCASVEEVLQTEFGLTLGSKGVNILDPCTGTGNFIVNIINRIPKKDLPRVYKEQLFANEVMLLPYYIAAMNIEHAYWERTDTYEPFEGLCFVDTLDMTEDEYVSLFTLENTARIRRQKKTPITVIIGNPPYNMAQQNENDNNKNRKYQVIDNRVKATYTKDGTATNLNKLSDPYVKFFRWATDRLSGHDGVVCFVSNNSFVDQLAFDGMRKHLLADFTSIYHLDLHGNVQKNPKLSGTTHNVFGIKVGVGITLAVRTGTTAPTTLCYSRLPENWRKEEKLDWLAKSGAFQGITLQTLVPDERSNWIPVGHANEFLQFMPIGSKAAKASKTPASEVIFKTYCIGVVTNRDDVVYGFDKQVLRARIEQFIEDYNGEVFRYHKAGAKADVDGFVRYDKIKWSRDLKRDLKLGKHAEFSQSKMRASLYRPFCRKWLFFDAILNQDVVRWPYFLPTSEKEAENKFIGLTDAAAEKPFMALVVASLTDLHLVGAGCGTQCFPFYVYDEDGANRRENITDWALEQFRTHHKDPKIAKWDVFHYVYGLLHHPGYRTKFADNLKRQLPRIPFALDFWAFAKAGQELARLHLDYEKLEPYPLKFIETEDVPLSYRIENKMRLERDKTKIHVNPSLTLSGIPPETFEYRLGNRSALEWVIDQYQVSEDKRSGIRSDPNREDDEQYIVRLVGQVVRVSLETVKIVKGLPEQYAP
jgi:predicted helicase